MMTKVVFTYENGRVVEMKKNFADVLQKMKRGTYMTKDMNAERDNGSAAGNSVSAIVGGDVAGQDAGNADSGVPAAGDGGSVAGSGKGKKHGKKSKGQTE